MVATRPARRSSCQFLRDHGGRLGRRLPADDPDHLVRGDNAVAARAAVADRPDSHTAGRHPGPRDGYPGPAGPPPCAAARGGERGRGRAAARAAGVLLLADFRDPDPAGGDLCFLPLPVRRRILVFRQFARFAGEREQAGPGLLRAERARSR